MLVSGRSQGAAQREETEMSALTIGTGLVARVAAFLAAGAAALVLAAPGQAARLVSPVQATCWRVTTTNGPAQGRILVTSPEMETGGGAFITPQGNLIVNPMQRAAFRVERRHEAADAGIGAGDADDHHVADDERRHRAAVLMRRLGRRLLGRNRRLPAHRARAAIEGDETDVVGDEVDEIAAERDAPVRAQPRIVDEAGRRRTRGSIVGAPGRRSHPRATPAPVPCPARSGSTACGVPC